MRMEYFGLDLLILLLLEKTHILLCAEHNSLLGKYLLALFSCNNKALRLLERAQGNNSSALTSKVLLEQFNYLQLLSAPHWRTMKILFSMELLGWCIFQQDCWQKTYIKIARVGNSGKKGHFFRFLKPCPKRIKMLTTVAHTNCLILV